MSCPWISRLLVMLVAMLAFSFVHPVSVLAQSSPPDYDIPNGHFYSQAVPHGLPGEGFTVSDAGGIAFWQGFVERGSWQALGYPVSQRYSNDGRVAQAFERGVLVWNAFETTVDLLTRERAGEIPAGARVSERTHWQEGEAIQQPWSGWWWSVSGVGPALDDLGGPLSKYDQLVQSRFSRDAGTRDWERYELAPFGLGLLWAGHCNGWAAAAILEPEPTAPLEVGGISFSVGDQKGLLTDLHFADAALWGYGGADGLSPVDFHRALLTWMGEQKQAMIVTFQVGNGELWSFPAYRFELTFGADVIDPDVTLVDARVWLVDNDVPTDFVGSRSWPSDEGKRFTYRITGPPLHPTGGDWTGSSQNDRFGQPHQIWYPDSSRRNVERQLHAPGLEEAVIRQIVAPPLSSPLLRAI